MDKRFYISTPIYYTNDVPHIGHTGTTIYADVMARYHRAIGDQVFFLTGTDEHGEKVAASAKNAGMEPQAFVDQMAEKWKAIWNKLGISNDEFIRTTSNGHMTEAVKLLEILKSAKTPTGKDAIYEGTYKGIYCIGCEEFKTERDLVDGKCPEHRPDQLVQKEEKNYFFRISEYMLYVKDLISGKEVDIKYADGRVVHYNPIRVLPQNKLNEMMFKIDEYIKEGRDMSISRENVEWGIEIPWDKSQTTYVWVEALMNYYTATRFKWENGKTYEEFWPADVHFLGKGNNWFHTVIWPSMLIALGLPLPKDVYVHGYFNVNGMKMGKSLGNVISPDELVARYGIEGTRYLLCASMPYLDDSDVSWKWFDDKYNSGLANGFGNLVSRVFKLAVGLNIDIDTSKLGGYISEGGLALHQSYADYKLHDVVTQLDSLVRELNEYFTREEPWKKSEEDKKLIIQSAMEKLVIIAKLAEPIMPESSKIILDAAEARTIPENLFARITSEVL